MQPCDEEKQNGMNEFYGPGFNTSIKPQLRRSVQSSIQH
jgi:hypothetical protein